MASLTTGTSQLKQCLLDPKLAEEKLEKQARRRVQIIKEIMATEETYHRHLKLMADYFEIPLRAQKLLPNTQISIIFGNIQQLIQVNNELRLHLEEMEVGSAFLQMGHFLKLYSVYAKNHTLAITTLEDMESKNPDLVTFRTRQEDRAEVQMKLNALLITPVQRVPRYKLLLDDLLACTPMTHSDYPSLKKAAKQISTVARHINDHIKEHENFQKMIEIQKSLEGSGAPKIVAPGRRFIKEGILKRMSRNGGRSYERMFFLFSDMVMYAKPKLLDNGKHHNSCCCVLPLHHCSVENMFGCGASRESPMSPDDRGAMFRLSCKDENLLLYSENKETIVEWMTAFQDTIGQVKQCRQTLRKESSAKRPMRRSALQRQWRRDKMKKMRDDLKAADETTLVTDDDPGNTTCKTRTPASCRPEAQGILKYRRVLKQDGEKLFCTPKKKLKLDKEEVSTVAAPEDSFELVDDPGMDEFNVTMPRFFKQLSHLSMPDPAGNHDGSTLPGAAGHYERCGTLPQGACTQGLDGEEAKCNTAVDTLKRRLRNSKAGQTIRGSINRSLTRIKRRIRIPLPRKRTKSESAALGNDAIVPLELQESSADVFSAEDVPQERPEPENIYEEICFLPQPDLSLPPLSLNTKVAHPWEGFQKRRHVSVQSQNMSSLHLQNINNQPEGLMSSLLQPMSIQPESFCPPQSLSQRNDMPSIPPQRYSQPLSLNSRSHEGVSQGMNSFQPQSLRNVQRESLTSLDEPLSMDYLSVNSVGQENLNRKSSSGEKNLEQPLSMNYVQMSSMNNTSQPSLKINADDNSDEADRLSFFGMSGQYVRTQEPGFYGPENNFLSLPPVLDHRNGKRGPLRYGRSVSCSNQLPVLQELNSSEEAENHILTESAVKKSNDLSSNWPIEAWGENSNALKHESNDHLPSSTTSEVELEKKESCTIL